MASSPGGSGKIASSEPVYRCPAPGEDTPPQRLPHPDGQRYSGSVRRTYKAEFRLGCSREHCTEGRATISPLEGRIKIVAHIRERFQTPEVAADLEVFGNRNGFIPFLVVFYSFLSFPKGNGCESVNRAVFRPIPKRGSCVIDAKPSGTPFRRRQERAGASKGGKRNVIFRKNGQPFGEELEKSGFAPRSERDLNHPNGATAVGGVLADGYAPSLDMWAAVALYMGTRIPRLKTRLGGRVAAAISSTRGAGAEVQEPLTDMGHRRVTPVSDIPQTVWQAEEADTRGDLPRRGRVAR